LNSDTLEKKIERKLTENKLSALDVSLDGTRIAIGGNDRLVVVFTNKMEALYK